MVCWELVSWCRRLYCSILFYDVSHVCALTNVADNAFDRVITVDMSILRGAFRVLRIWLSPTLYIIRKVPEVVPRWASPGSRGISVAKCSPGNPSGNFDWCKAFEIVTDAFFYFGETDALSHYIVLEIPSSSVTAVSVIAERIQYGHNFCGDRV